MVGNKEMIYRHCFTVCHTTVQVKEDGLKLNSRHQLLVYAGDGNIFGGRICTIEKNTKF
jgi:hypothetical protein